MFTGIVEELGSLSGLRLGAKANRLTIAARVVLEGTRIGDSIAADGICVTVADLTPGAFTCDVMPETLRRSTLGHLRHGSRLNLERAVAYGGRVGGHYVQGHVDGVGQIRLLTGDGPALVVRIAAAPEVLRYVVPKGFIAVDGASLTVVDTDDTGFSVSLVYHTQQSITLPSKRPGDSVNLEVDIIGKYVERFVTQPGQPAAGLSPEFLARHGYA